MAWIVRSATRSARKVSARVQAQLNSAAICAWAARAELLVREFA